MSVEFNAQAKSVVLNAAGWHSRREEHVQRLAQLLNLDPDALAAELEDHRPMAQAVHAQGQTSCWEAWRRVWLAYRAKTDGRERHPGEVLGQALMRFGAWNGMTTSGVEQSFSKQCLVFGPQRKNMNANTEHDESILTLDRIADPQTRDALVKGAQKIWIQCKCGQPRRVAKARVDKGARRPLALRILEG